MLSLFILLRINLLYLLYVCLFVCYTQTRNGSIYVWNQRFILAKMIDYLQDISSYIYLRTYFIHFHSDWKLGNEFHYSVFIRFSISNDFKRATRIHIPRPGHLFWCYMTVQIHLYNSHTDFCTTLTNSQSSPPPDYGNLDVRSNTRLSPSKSDFTFLKLRSPNRRYSRLSSFVRYKFLHCWKHGSFISFFA